MVSKNEVLNYLLELKEKNKDVEKYINLLNNISEDEWGDFADNHSLNNLNDVKNEINKRLETPSQNFTKLNDLVSFGRNDNTIHIHLVPTDAHFLLNRKGLKNAEMSLLDALEKIQDMMKDDKYKDINNVYAVSGLIKRPIDRIFVKLGFDVKTMKIDDAKNDEELGVFYGRFKDKKDLGRAKISREKLLSKEWNDMKKEIKERNINEQVTDKSNMSLNESKLSIISSAIEETKKTTRFDSIKKQEETLNHNLDLNKNKDISE